MDNKNRARRHADVLRSEIDGGTIRIEKDKLTIRAKSKAGYYYEIGYVYFHDDDTLERMEISEIDHYNRSSLFCEDGEVSQAIKQLKRNWIHENASE